MSPPKAHLIHGDAVAALRSMPSASVDAVVCDPPYGCTELDWDTPVDWHAWWHEARRVARPDAAFVLFAQQPFATDLINSNRRQFRYELVWKKNKSTGFLDVRRRPMRSHELVLIFGDRIRYNRVDWARRTPKMRLGGTIKRRAGDAAAPSDHWGDYSRRKDYVYGPTEAPKSVLEFPAAGNSRARDRPDYHPTAKPLALMEWLVASYSDPGDLVADTFMGAGPTGHACANLGRRFAGVERDATFFARAEARIRAAELARVPA